MNYSVKEALDELEKHRDVIKRALPEDLVAHLQIVADRLRRSRVELGRVARIYTEQAAVLDRFNIGWTKQGDDPR